MEGSKEKKKKNLLVGSTHCIYNTCEHTSYDCPNSGFFHSNSKKKMFLDSHSVEFVTGKISISYFEGKENKQGCDGAAAGFFYGYYGLCIQNDETNVINK